MKDKPQAILKIGELALAAPPLVAAAELLVNRQWAHGLMYACMSLVVLVAWQAHWRAQPLPKLKLLDWIGIVLPLVMIVTITALLWR